MHERKALMAELADGFIALPGGIGTLEEFAEIVTWAQLGLHAKPTGLLNLLGYYDGLLGFLDHATAERFVRPDHREMILARPSAAELLAAMDGWTAPPRPRPSGSTPTARTSSRADRRRPRQKVELAPPRYEPLIRIMEALGPIRSGRYG